MQKNFRRVKKNCAHKLKSAKKNFPRKFSCISDQLINFDAVNLKFVQIVGNIVVYNL